MDILSVEESCTCTGQHMICSIRLGKMTIYPQLFYMWHTPHSSVKHKQGNCGDRSSALPRFLERFHPCSSDQDIMDH